jgi:hypothetical protein
VNYFAIPNDVTGNRLMVEVHYYDPYNFTLNSSSNITQWGKNATVPSKTETWANESYADGQFQKMKAKFIDKGYAVILGEYGVISRLGLGSTALNNEYAGYRRYYMEYVTGSMFKHGLAPFYWDNGGTGNYSLGIFERSTGAKAYPDIVKAITDAVDTTNVSSGVRNMFSAPVVYSLMQNYPNPFNPRTTISYSLPRASTVTLKVYDVLGRDIVTLVDNQRNTAGKYDVPVDGTHLASGIYYYNLWTEGYRETKMMVLVK